MTNEIKINDSVRINRFPADHMNGLARVVGFKTVDGEAIGVYVSNGNMPYAGTFCGVFFPFSEVTK